MKPLMIGVGALALATATALSAQGHGHGNGAQDKAKGHQAAGSMSSATKGHGNAMRGAAAAKEHGNGQGNAMRASGSMQASRPGNGHGNAAHASGSMQAQTHGQANDKAPGKGQGHGNAAGHPDNGHGPDKAMAERGHDKPNKAAPAQANAPVQARNGSDERAGVRVLADGRRYYSKRDARPEFNFAAARRGVIDGCPPGLARKDNGCMPPGLARQRAWQPNWWGMRSLNGPYYYNDGYLVRLNGGRIAGYIPLLGGALAVGNPWPSYYEPVPVPDYYVNYYGLGPAGGYRYADNALYRVDPATSAITAIAALLTGDNFAIGQPLPLGYDVYNVPYRYRTQYVDGPNSWYRYSDGYVYQVDPTTRLVTAAIELLAS
jgi:hypothetical protein